MAAGQADHKLNGSYSGSNGPSPGDRGDGEGQEFLFRPSLIDSLAFSDCFSNLRNNTDFELRPLKKGDFETGFLELLGQLTRVGPLDRTAFNRRFDEMKNSGCHYVVVVEDKNKGRVVGSSTLAIELKFIHEAGLRARLEDVVVAEESRGQRLGQLLVETVRLLARDLGCYKLSLDCKDQVIPFYNTLGFVAEPGRANMLVIRFKD